MKRSTCSLALPLALALAGADATAADDVVAFGSITPDLFRLDSNAGLQAPAGSVTLTHPSEIGIGALARTTDGKLWGLSAAPVISQIAKPTARLYSIDEATPAAAFVADIGQGVPVGAAVDPTDGSLWFLLTFTDHPVPTLNRYDFAIASVTDVKPVSIALAQQALVGLAFDASGQLYSLSTQGSSLWRIDKVDPANGTSGPVGTGLGAGIDLLSGGALTSDPFGGGMLAYEVAQKRLIAIDPAAGTGQVRSALPGPDVLAMAPVECATEYGPGCVGAIFVTPRLRADGCPSAGVPFRLMIEDALGGSTAALLIGLGAGTLPIGFGCDVVVAPVLPQVAFLPLGGVGAGQGKVVLATVVPPGVPAGAAVHLQALVADPNVQLGRSATNGLRLEFL
ncbi:MAG: hypothetical protein ACF8XB_02945 [Planctomycetota bacterium JB042]